MGTEQEAYAAYQRWLEGMGYRGYSDTPVHDVEDAFMAGHEAGYTALRDSILRMWDENDGWIAGADYHRLAATLGVPPERTRSYRQGGQSRPAQSARSRNIPLG